MDEYNEINLWFLIVYIVVKFSEYRREFLRDIYLYHTVSLCMCTVYVCVYILN